MNIGSMIPRRYLEIDGHASPATLDMIKDFQTRVMGKTDPDGVVDPGGATLRELRRAVMPVLTEDKLRAVMTNASLANARLYLQPIINAMNTYSINTGMRMAQFLGQLGVECDDLNTAEEYASGAAYEGRTDLGNTEKGDGRRFKGRGLIQITGRSNYQAYGDYKKKDYVSGDNPGTLASDPDVAADASGWFWMSHGLNDVADGDKIRAVTKIVNGQEDGKYTHLDQRIEHMRRAKCLLVR